MIKSLAFIWPGFTFGLDDSSFYGFGEKTGRLEKAGTSMRMSNKDACYTVARKDNLVIIGCTASGCFEPSERITYQIQCTTSTPVEIFWNNVRLPQILDEDRFQNEDQGWHYFHSTKVCAVKCGAGRNLDKLLVNFGKFDLIRMDSEP